MLWQSKRLKQRERDRQMEGEKEGRVNCNTTGLSTCALLSA